MARKEPARQEYLTADDMKVMSLNQWCKLNGFSLATGKRIIASPNGPKVIQLSLRRFGIRMIDNARWQESCARA